jgi:hypothetical protein
MPRGRVTPGGSDFASEEQPQLSDHGIDRPYLLVAATYVCFGTHRIAMIRIISNQKRKQRARVNEQHAQRLRDRRDFVASSRFAARTRPSLLAPAD